MGSSTSGDSVPTSPTPERPAEASLSIPAGSGAPLPHSGPCPTASRPLSAPCGKGTERGAAPPRCCVAARGPQPTPQHLPLGERTPRVQPACRGAELLRHPSAAAPAPTRQRKTSEAQQESGGRLGGPDARPWAVCCLASGHFCLLLGRSETGRGRAALPSPALPAGGLE